MDEYLFMTLAKLKADRLKLQREERAKAAARTRATSPGYVGADRHDVVLRHVGFHSNP